MQVSILGSNAMLAGLIALVGASGKCQIFDGAMPAATTTADAGTKVADISLPNPAMGTPSGRVAAMAGTWSDTDADATGLGRYYRIKDGSAVVITQGLVSEAWQASKAYILNQQASLGGNVYKVTTAGTSAGSGGPTGTGSGITDGGVTWAYVGPTEMVLDNTNLNIHQSFAVTSYTWTDNNG